MIEGRGGRGVVLLIHGLWFRPSIWTPWLPELDEAGYDCFVLSWPDENQPANAGTHGQPTDFTALLRAARRQIDALSQPPIAIGHGVGATIAARLLFDGDAAAAVALAPVPSGYPAIPTAVHLLRSRGLTKLALHDRAVVPSFAQFRRAIANAGSTTDAQRLYDRHVNAASPRAVVLPAVRHSARARTRRVRRGPLLLAVGGEDELVREASIAWQYRRYRRQQPDAVTDYKVFPGSDHTFDLGTEGLSVLFYCLDWLTAQNL